MKTRTLRHGILVVSLADRLRDPLQSEGEILRLPWKRVEPVTRLRVRIQPGSLPPKEI
jgi:hypothetical protein